METIQQSTSNLTKSSDLKTLHWLSQNREIKDNVHSVLIIHVLPTAKTYIELVHQVFPIQLIIAIPYSADRATIEWTESKGIPVFLPSSVEETFLRSGELVEQILQKNSHPLVVQEVGGYLAGYTDQLTCYSHFKGIVEDTNNGHWRYQQAGEHRCPVISMAQSSLKDIEDTLIGDGVVYSTERVFREEFNAVLQGCHAGVIGYGKIGSSTSVALRGRECQVSIYDIHPGKTIQARFQGFSIAPLQKLLATCDLIIGCTGRTSIQKEDIASIKQNAILVSASAKNEEFNLQAFQEECTLQKISPILWSYEKKNKECFYLLNEGTPINFRDRSILGTVLDMIYSELYVCMEEVAFSPLKPGLQHSSAILQAKVAKAWLHIYEKDFIQHPRDKIWQFPESFALTCPKTYFLQTQALSLESR